MVKCAKYAYENFHTVVNALKESGITYNNSLESYAEMDNKFSKSRLGIGWSSNLAMLALTYYWTELEKDEPDEQVLRELHDNFIILAVLAQLGWLNRNILQKLFSEFLESYVYLYICQSEAKPMKVSKSNRKVQRLTVAA